MATTATRSLTITFTNDVTGTITKTAVNNTASPATTDLVTLSSGANTITAPTGGSTPVAVTIIPPAANAVAITLKGVAGDTGIRIHNTDPTTIAIDPSVTTFVLNAASTVTGLRLIWN